MTTSQISATSFQPELCRRYFESRLQVRKIHGHAKINVRCPFHDDSTPSLSVNLDDGVWFCHAGCGHGGILAFEEKFSGCDHATARANVSDLLGMKFGPMPEAQYLYRDAKGKLIFRKQRFSGKTFRCQRPGADGVWIDNLDGIEIKPLYNLPELVRATYAIVVEGEKDADRLTSLNLSQYDDAGLPIAITSNFDGAGTGKWRSEYSPYFTGKEVVIIPDNDEGGREHALAAARGIAHFAAGVKIIFLPNLPEHGDVSDFLDGGNGAGELLTAIDAASPWSEEKTDLPPSRFRSIAEISLQSSENLEWIIPYYIQPTALTQLAAKIKAGKTSLVLSACRAVLTGGLFLGQRAKHGKVVMVTEQSGSSFHEALKRAGLVGIDGMSIMQRHDTFGLDWAGIVAAAVAECERVHAVLLIFDTLNQLAGLSGDDENSAGKMLEAMRPLQQACGHGWGVWYTVHERKSGGDVADAARGSSATGGVADVLMSLRRPDGNHGIQQETVRKISTISRFSETPNELVIDWKGLDGEYAVLGDSDSVTLDRTVELVMRALPDAENAAKTVPVLIEETGASRATVRRALKELEAARLGDGEKGNPFRYWLKVTR